MYDPLMATMSPRERAEFEHRFGRPQEKQQPEKPDENEEVCKHIRQLILKQEGPANIKLLTEALVNMKTVKEGR